ncbi:DUF222 domain-containing protein [Gordonia iterans]
MDTLTGERLEPRLSATAAAVADGEAGGAHVAAVTEIMDKLPSAVTHDQRVKAEAMLADAARRLDPAAVTVVGNRILAWLDPDGTLADDHDRARRRTFNLQPQNRQLMSKVRALLTPVLRAKLEVVLHQWATAGMNNPDDTDSPRGAADQPGLDPAVLAAAAERDTRTLGQRQHDALQALCDWALALAGQPAPTRIPSQVVVTVTDEDLARQAGIGWTATGTRMPVSDLVQFAADTVPYLAVFSKATGRRSPEHARLDRRRCHRPFDSAQDRYRPSRRGVRPAQPDKRHNPGALGVDGPHLRSRRRTRRLAARRTRHAVAEQHPVPPRTPRTRPRPRPPGHSTRAGRPRTTRRLRATWRHRTTRGSRATRGEGPGPERRSIESDDHRPLPAVPDPGVHPGLPDRPDLGSRTDPRPTPGTGILTAPPAARPPVLPEVRLTATSSDERLNHHHPQVI